VPFPRIEVLLIDYINVLPCDKQLCVFGGSTSFSDGNEPHVLEDFHDQLSNALLVVDSPNHLDADFGDFVVAGVTQAYVFQNFDHSFSNADSGILEKKVQDDK